MPSRSGGGGGTIRRSVIHGVQVETWPAVYARHQPRGEKKDQPGLGTRPAQSGFRSYGLSSVCSPAFALSSLCPVRLASTPDGASAVVVMAVWFYGE